jgi:hypothetical protein
MRLGAIAAGLLIGLVVPTSPAAALSDADQVQDTMTEMF